MARNGLGVTDVLCARKVLGPVLSRAAVIVQVENERNPLAYHSAERAQV